MLFKVRYNVCKEYEVNLEYPKNSVLLPFRNILWGSYLISGKFSVTFEAIAKQI